MIHYKNTNTYDILLNMQQKKQRGFTIVELSVVIVIIGLLISGIIAGDILLKAAEIRSVISDVNGYKSAVRNFEEIYNNLPGDMPNADDYWAGTANGNGNGRVEYSGGAGGEDLRAWQVLALSKTIPGEYSGLTSGGAYNIGTNIPPSEIIGGGYVLHYPDAAGTAIYGRFGNLIQFAAEWQAGSFGGIILTARQAIALDKKIDDGLADQGNVYGSNGGIPSSGLSNDCTTNDIDQTSSTYLPDEITVACRMFFWLD